MAKNGNILEEKKPLEKVKQSSRDDDRLVDECQNHESDSWTYYSTVRNTWDDKEAMLLAKTEDALTKKGAKSRVYDPVLSTIVWERGARVMAQPASGNAFAVSKNDLGKNMVMNLLLRYFTKNANEEFSQLLKLRFMDIYSNVYGTFFGLVPWRVNLINGYIGPEFLTINMRDARPQPGRKNIDKSDWFGVRSSASVAWLEKQDQNIWNQEAIAVLKAQLKEKKSKGDSATSDKKETQTWGERDRFPGAEGDAVFPDIRMFTEYRQEMWITWAPAQINPEKNRPFLLRVVKNPYPKGFLPIVAKHAFPLLDSMIGLGEFERGKTLQYALNSLINLYLDGVKMSIFPPLHIDLSNVVPSSIKWGAAEKWYMNNPNRDVQLMNLNPTSWINTFQSTYGFLMAALQNLSGSTVVAQAGDETLALGKTPEALKQYGFKESARDEWDRFMMEECIQGIYDRWTALLANKLDVPITMRIFGAEIEDIKKQFPNENILEVFESGRRGNLKVDKSLLNDKDKIVKYDYEIEAGSTMKRNNADESVIAGEIIKDIIAAPQLLQEIRAKGKDLDVAELYKRRMIGGGLKDWDRILIPLATQNTGTIGESVPGPAGTGEVMAGSMPGAHFMTPQGKSSASTPTNAQPAANGQQVQFNDEEIANAAMQVLGGVSGIPAAG